MNYIITFTETEILSIIPVADDAEILGGTDYINTTLQNGRTMLEAIGVNVQKIDEYVEV